MSRVFDAYSQYYDLLYKDKDYQTESEYIQSLLKQSGMNHGDILELGSGTGRHAFQLAHSGFSVHGIDLSEKMVDRAKKNTPDAFAEQLSFEVGDVRSIRMNKRFDAVISLFHVTSYQTENTDLQAMFTTASKHLKPGGLFVFDFWHGPGVLTDPPVVRIKRMQDKDLNILRLAEPELHCNKNRVDVHYTIMMSQPDERVQYIEETHQMRYLFIPEIELMLNSAGFILTHSYSWMSNKPLDFDSWLGVVCARKAN